MFQIDNQSRNAVYEQIVSQIEKYILTGLMVSNEQMPSVRALSLDLHLNPNTVQKAYTELDRRGLIYSTSGVGSFISDQAKDILRKERREKINDLKPIIKDLKIAGIEKKEIIHVVDKVYEEEENDNS